MLPKPPEECKPPYVPTLPPLPAPRAAAGGQRPEVRVPARPRPEPGEAAREAALLPAITCCVPARPPRREARGWMADAEVSTPGTGVQNSELAVPEPERTPGISRGARPRKRRTSSRRGPAPTDAPAAAPALGGRTAGIATRRTARATAAVLRSPRQPNRPAPWPYC